MNSTSELPTYVKLFYTIHMTLLYVKVTPNAKQNQIIGMKEGVLCVRIRGVPEKGRVNEELIAFLAETLGLAKSQIEIVSGHTSRLKRIRIEGKINLNRLSSSRDSDSTA